jgi:hypothetical protein
MKNVDQTAAFRLLETGTLVEFQVVRTQIHEGFDAAEFSVEKMTSNGARWASCS